jgi:hypothetical protein
MGATLLLAAFAIGACPTTASAAETDAFGADFHTPSAAERALLPDGLKTAAALAGPYNIANDHSGLYLEVYHSGTANGSLVDQYVANQTSTQKWFIVSDPQGAQTWFNFLNVNSGKCLDTSGDMTNGTQLKVWTCENGNPHQQFQVLGVACAGVCLTIHARENRSKCVEVFHSSLANAAKVDLFDCNNTLTQQWQKVGATP